MVDRAAALGEVQEGVMEEVVAEAPLRPQVVEMCPQERTAEHRFRNCLRREQETFRCTRYGQ